MAAPEFLYAFGAQRPLMGVISLNLQRHDKTGEEMIYFVGRIITTLVMTVSALAAAEKPITLDVHFLGGGLKVATVSGSFEISKKDVIENVRVRISPHSLLTVVTQRAIAQWIFQRGSTAPTRLHRKFYINYRYAGDLDAMAQKLLADQTDFLSGKYTGF